MFHALEPLALSDRGEYELSEAVGLLAAAGLQIEPVRLAAPRVTVNRRADLERASQLFEE